MSTEETERHLRSMIAQVHREYQAAVAPYVNRLAQIEAMKAPRPVVVDISALPPAILEVTKRKSEQNT